MYNAAQKERFVKGFTDSVSVRESALRIFNATEKFEAEIDTDVAAMDLETLQRVFIAISGVRTKSKFMPRYILREYARWATENGIPGASDAVLYLDDSGLEKLRAETLKNPKQLQVFLDIICDPESEHTSDNNIRAWCWLAYAGLDDDEAMRVLAEDLDFSSMTIHHGGFSYPIYREAIPAFQNCVSLSQYRYIHPLYGADKIVYRDRMSCAELLRGIRGVPSLHTMRVEFSRRAKRAEEQGKTALRLSYMRIWMSGVFYRMYEDELAGIPVNFGEVTNRKLGDKQFKLDSGRNTQAYKRKVVSEEYRADYERWKQTLI